MAFGDACALKQDAPSFDGADRRGALDSLRRVRSTLVSGQGTRRLSPGGLVAKLGRLRRRADFARVRSARDAVSLKSMLAFRVPGDADETRLGISVTRRTGNAVKRNRIRRRLRAAFAAELDGSVGPLDIVAVGRAAAELPYADLRGQCRRVYEARLRSGSRR